MVKCWDLEYNKVVRHYHGHLSGVYSMALHPTIDLLMTGGRDSAVRVWDIRTKVSGSGWGVVGVILSTHYSGRPRRCLLLGTQMESIQLVSFSFLYLFLFLFLFLSPSIP